MGATKSKASPPLSHYFKYNKTWRKEHPKEWQAMKQKNYAARRFGPGRRPWSTADLELVLHSDLSDTKLAMKLNRSVQAIQIQRCRALYRLQAKEKD